MSEALSKHGIYRVCRIAGLTERSWHCLRHTYATHLALLGVNPLRLQAWLGHADMGMTLRYCHHAEAHAWPIPDDVLTAGAELLDPSRRVVAQLGARVVIAPPARAVDMRLRGKRDSVATVCQQSGVTPLRRRNRSHPSCAGRDSNPHALSGRGF